MEDLHIFAIFSVVLGVGVGGGELLRAVAGMRPESSRRFVHGYTGLAVAVAPAFFARPTWLYVLAGAFVLVNSWAIPRRVFKGMHDIERQSVGTVVFPLALLFALWGCWTLDPGRVFALQLAFLVLALSDPLASWVGTSLRRPGTFTVGTDTKSRAGTLAFFTSAVVIVWGGLTALDPLGYSLGAYLLTATLVGALATLAELLGSRGWDNLSIVLAVTTPLVALHSDPGALEKLLYAGAWSAAFGAVSYRLRLLDLSGTLAASLLGVMVLGLGDWGWALPGFAFFILSSALSKVGKKRKLSAVRAEKGSRRDAGQVYANGGLAGALLLLYVYDPHPWQYWGFVGAFAAAAADTWATEIGTYFHAPTRSVWTWRPVPPGVSGGVSLPGTLGALAGAATVFAPLPLVAPERIAAFGWGPALTVVAAGGLLASLLDSMLGATAQALYRDRRSSELTERPAEGGLPNTLIRGWAWMNNDRVNLACTAAGATMVAATLGL